MTQAIDVRCEPAPGGWTCSVEVGGPGAPTSHVVSVSAADLDRLAPGRHRPRGPRPSLVCLPARARAEGVHPGPLRPAADRPLLPGVRARDQAVGRPHPGDADLRRALEAAGCHDSRVRFGTGLARRRVRRCQQQSNRSRARASPRHGGIRCVRSPTGRPRPSTSSGRGTRPARHEPWGPRGIGGRGDRSRNRHRGGTGSGRAPDGPPADGPARADLAVLAGPDGDRRRGRPVHLVPARVHGHPGRHPAGHGHDPAHHRRGAPRDHRPAHGRLHQRLRRHEVGTSQAVHRVRLAARRRLPGRDRQQQHAPGARRLRDAADLLHEHRARAVPGLRAGPRRRGPGRIGERHGRHDADPRQRHGPRPREPRGDHRQPGAGPVRGGDRGAGDDGSASS